MNNLKVIRETLDEGFRYVLYCNNRITDFKKSEKEFAFAGISTSNSRIFALISSADEHKADNIIIKKVEPQTI
jgi:hypothetical protein